MSEEKRGFVGGKALLDAEPAPRRPLVGFGAEPSPNVEQSRPAVSSQPIPSHQPATSLPTAGSQPTESREPVPSSQPNASHHTSSNILSSIPEVDGHTTLPHRYTDHLCRWLTPDEQAIYTQLYRLSWGWGKDTCFISNPRLSERSNVPLSTMKRAIQKLIIKGLVEKTGGSLGYGKEQGVEYRVLKVSSQPTAGSRPALSSQPTAGTNKEKELKEIDKRESCPICKDTSGFVYIDKGDPSKGVFKCKHGK